MLTLKEVIMELKVELSRDGETAKLLVPVTVKTSLGEITVPAGSFTDFASIPRIFWSIFPPVGKYATAALVHDYLYREKFDKRFNRKEADDIFLELMTFSGVPSWQAYAMYYAVRLFGKSKWVKG
jgi:hypothetical protein